MPILSPLSEKEEKDPRHKVSKDGYPISPGDERHYKADGAPNTEIPTLSSLSRDAIKIQIKTPSSHVKGKKGERIPGEDFIWGSSERDTELAEEFRNKIQGGKDSEQ